MTNDSERPYKRGSTRFKPDEGVYALIDPRPGDGEFEPTIPALVFSEAHKGAGLVVISTPKLQVGDTIRVQVGQLPPLPAQVRWREQVDAQVLKIGLMYLA